MKARTIGLRIASLIFGLICIAHIARWWARTDIVIGGYYVGQSWSVIGIIITGGLSIWLAKLAGPWCAAPDGAQKPEI
jgi:hypothetical protein